MTTWWLWIIAALGLLAVELLSPGGFYFIFFAIGAGLVGLLLLLGIELPLWGALGLFSVLSVAAMLAFRKPLMAKISSTAAAEVDQPYGEEAIASAHIAAGAEGRVEFRGSSWKARNIGATPIAAGCKCYVEKIDNLTVLIREKTL